MYILSPGQTIATSQCNISQHCWPSICKLKPNDRQHLSTTYRYIVGRNMLHAFGHPIATCCDVLRVESHAQAEHCCRGRGGCSVSKGIRGRHAGSGMPTSIQFTREVATNDRLSNIRPCLAISPNTKEIVENTMRSGVFLIRILQQGHV